MGTLIFSIILAIIAIILFAVWAFNKGIEDRPYYGWGSLGVAVFLAFFLFAMGLTKVNSGTVKVPRVFGKISHTYVDEGLSIINPIASTYEMTIKREHVNVDDGDTTAGMLCTSADNVQMKVEVNFAFSINPQYAWWILREIGDFDKLVSSIITPASQSSARDASAAFKLEEAQKTQRLKYETMLEKQFRSNVIAALPRNKGLNESELKLVITFFPVQLKNVLPDSRVSLALSEKKAAEIDLERQVTLTAIAKEQANRMENQGQGVTKIFNELPKGHSADEVEKVLNALANFKRAESFVKAVETGQIKGIMFEGQAARIVPN